MLGRKGVMGWGLGREGEERGGGGLWRCSQGQSLLQHEAL